MSNRPNVRSSIRAAGAKNVRKPASVDHASHTAAGGAATVKLYRTTGSAIGVASPLNKRQQRDQECRHGMNSLLATELECLSDGYGQSSCNHFESLRRQFRCGCLASHITLSHRVMPDEHLI